MEKISLKAQKRELGKRVLKAARREGYLPAIIYGHNFKTAPVQVRIKDFEGVYAQAGESSLIYLDLNSQSLPVIIHGVVRDPLSDFLVHADFYKVNLDEKITADVPLIFVGEAPAVKNLAGILVKNMNAIKVEALPQNLPHVLEVNISGLDRFGSTMLIKDLTLPAGVELKEKEEAIIVLVQEPISQEELDKQLAVPEAGVPEVEIIKKEKEEAPAEGEEAPALAEK